MNIRLDPFKVKEINGSAQEISQGFYERITDATIPEFGDRTPKGLTDGNQHILSGHEDTARRNGDGLNRNGLALSKQRVLLSLPLTAKIQFTCESPVPSEADEAMPNSQNYTQGSRKRQRDLLIAFCLLIAAFAVAWLSIPHLPADYTCEFRDRPFLRWLWLGNQAIYNDLILWKGADNEDCNLLSTQSVLSVFCASFSIFFFVLISRARPAMRPRPISVTLLMVLMLLGLQVDGFNDHAIGRGAWAAYHTTDSSNVIQWKTLVRMLPLYLLSSMWMVHLRTAWLKLCSK
ncbi:hypothetical protein NKJ59_14180 [Mesorhizobium australicum]|uniref:hypothetical protein n=1 Tax=Mesorhizobium australicum TaxID=536018 RepID=UPI0033383781